MTLRCRRESCNGVAGPGRSLTYVNLGGLAGPSLGSHSTVWVPSADSAALRIEETGERPRQANPHGLNSVAVVFDSRNLQEDTVRMVRALRSEDKLERMGWLTVPLEDVL